MKNKILKILAIIAAIAVTLYLIGFIIGIISSIKKNPKTNKYGIIEMEKATSTFTHAYIEYFIEDESIVKFDHMETKDETKKDVLGGTSKELYYFAGVNTGKTNIIFRIKDGHEDITEQYEYEVNVDKNLKVNITEKQKLQGIYKQIVYARIRIQENDESTQRTSMKLNTYEELINSTAIKKVVENKYGKIGNVKFEEIKDTDAIGVVYFCDEHTDEECKQILQELIQEFSKRIKEVYDSKDVKIINEPEISQRSVIE